MHVEEPGGSTAGTYDLLNALITGDLVRQGWVGAAGGIYESPGDLDARRPWRIVVLSL
jgi:hypothetical protein